MNQIFKKVMSYAILLLAVFSVVACTEATTTTTTSSGTTTTTTTTAPEPQTLVVGVPEMNGEFMFGFGNSSYDNYVRSLIYGYGTYASTPTGEIVLNDTVVTDLATATDVDGNKTYTFTLAEDLLWSDGEAIMADDFVFAILFNSSIDWINAGATSASGEGLLGYDAYRDPVDGDEEPLDSSIGVPFAGVKLLGDYEFSLTIDAAELPYFYETLYVSYGPMPMHVLAADGATITSTAAGATLSVGALDTMDDIIAIGGYRYHPTVTAGPYTFVNFVNQVVTLEKDPNFKGNYAGDNVTIDTVIIKRVNQTLDVELVISGEIDLVTGVIEGNKIQAAQASTTASANYYNRNGFGYLGMVCDWGPTADVKVRQAIAHLTDRQYVVDQVLEGYGSIVYSEYGLAQWMYVDSETWVEDNIDPYVFSVAQANALLDDTVWAFESDGTTAFNPALATAGSGYFRYNAAGEPLEIKHFGTENNQVTTSLQAKFELNLQLAGIDYSITIGTFDTLLDHYYYSYELADEDRVYSLFNLATNFGTTYDPYYSWSQDWLGTWYNANQLDNEALSDLTSELRAVAPGDNAAFLAIWREFQLLWNELIPNVPLYSNQYYDIFDANLQGVNTTPFYDWTAAIFDMYFE
ncbi:MAG: ABC transporter substrate-binding protein [Firmicutes bacterium]|nr:ABC transporter substrate-binding protein [Bacillota bacterium]